MTSDGKVDFIDEDDAGGVLLALGEEIPHTRRPDADEHLDESDPLMLRKGTSASPAIARASRVFPVPGCPTSSKPLGIPLPTLYISSDLAGNRSPPWEFGLGLNPGYIGKGDLFRFVRNQTGAALSKSHRFSSAALHLPHEKIQTPIKSSIGSQETQRGSYTRENHPPACGDPDPSFSNVTLPHPWGHRS